ncbi:MAG: DUF2141 domain-containing protein [Myxococcota bacterium]|nr:DUF2141 domain-containing protein [Myxococcota bacterium]
MLLAGCLGALVSCPLAAGAEAKNRIEFRAHFEERGGSVRCGLFQRSGWLKKPLRAAAARANASPALCVFEDVPPGSYGISAFHDRNDNEKLDTNLIGVPVEDYGASNNARGVFGPPKFDDARFVYKGGTKHLQGTLE